MMTLNPMNRGWEDLANAVVMYAVHDWCIGMRESRNLRNAHLDKLRLKRSTEQFFYSAWCEALCGVDGRDILRRLMKSDEREVLARLNRRYRRENEQDNDGSV